jgi:peptide chain release factor 3
VNGDKKAIDDFIEKNKLHISHDHDGDVVYLTRLQWDIDRVERDYPDVHLTATKEMMI